MCYLQYCKEGKAEERQCGDRKKSAMKIVLMFKCASSQRVNNSSFETGLLIGVRPEDLQLVFDTEMNKILWMQVF